MLVLFYRPVNECKKVFTASFYDNFFFFRKTYSMLDLSSFRSLMVLHNLT